MDKEKIYNESIILVGPVGAGKSLLSERLAKRTGMPIVTTDILRQCPKNVNELEIRKNNLIKEMEKADSKHKIDSLYNEKMAIERLIAVRQMLPNVPNYKEMGYDVEISNFLRREFGEIAWHFYEKQFENQLLESLLQQLPCPCIVDMGGGMSIALERDYINLAAKFQELNSLLFEKYFDIKKIGFHNISKALKPFKKIVSLQLPKDYKQTMHKAGKDRLNEAFISTGQYDRIATKHVSVEGLVNGEKVNEEIAKKLVDDMVGAEDESYFE